MVTTRRRPRFLRGSRLLAYAGLAGVALVMIAILLPLGLLVVTSVLTEPIGSDGEFTLSNYADVLTGPDALQLLINTFIYTIGSSVLALSVASLFAWAVTRVDIPGRRILRYLPLLSLALPHLLKDTAWIQLLSPRGGLGNIAFQSLFNVDGPLIDIYTMGGLIVVTGLYAVPLPYLILLAPFESLDNSFEEASLVSGASGRRTMRRITVRLLAPAMISAFALVFILIAGTFETPLLIGLPGDVSTYISAVYKSLTVGSPNFPLASAQGTWYLLFTVLAFLWYLRATRRERRFVSVTGRARRGVTPVPRWLALGLAALIVLDAVLGFVVPLALTILTSFVPVDRIRAGDWRVDWNLETFSTVLESPAVQDAIVYSTVLACIVSVLAVLIGLMLSYIALKTTIVARRGAEIVGTLPVAVPGVVFGVTLLITFLVVPGVNVLYGTLVPVIVADVVVVLPFAVRAIASGLVQVDNDILEAGAVSGASRLRVARNILVPLLSGAIANALVISFIVSFRELGAIVLLLPPDVHFIPTTVWNDWVAGLVDRVNVLNLVSVVIPFGVAALWFLGRWGTRVTRRVRSSSRERRDFVRAGQPAEGR